MNSEKTMTKKISANTQTKYFVKKNELPLSCPTKEMLLWNAHPRVYLPLGEENKEAICPYCDAKFTLIDE